MSIQEMNGKFTVVSARSSRDAHGQRWDVMVLRHIKSGALMMSRSHNGQLWTDPEPVPEGIYAPAH